MLDALFKHFSTNEAGQASQDDFMFEWSFLSCLDGPSPTFLSSDALTLNLSS